MVCRVFDLSRGEFDWALLNPDLALPHWVEKLRTLRASNLTRNVHAWLRNVVDGARPSGALYRWLRGGSPHPSLVVSFKGSLWKGPAAFFSALREYWGSIMGEAPEERDRLKFYTDSLTPETTLKDERAHKALTEAIASMRKDASAGLDRWPVMAFQALNDQGKAALLRLYDICETTACWPVETHAVRTHLIPKPGTTAKNAILEPDTLRPIAIISVWLRLWSKWRLILLGQEVFRQFEPTICGGIPGRTMYPNVLDLLLSLEEAVLCERGEAPFCCISVDASKCFDRIRPTYALKLAQAKGVDARTLKGLGGFLLQLDRRLSCASSLDTLSLIPSNGILQGDPLSVLLCNFCIQDWHKRVKGEEQLSESETREQTDRKAQVRACAYVDDRTLVTSSMETMQRAWDRSVSWDCDSGWKVNRNKTHLLAVGLGRNESRSMMWGEDKMIHTRNMKILGHEVAGAYSDGGKLQRQRTLDAQKAA